MIALDEVYAALVAFLCRRENFIRFQVEEAKAHGAMTHDAFEVAASSTAAVVLLGIERDDGMAALPGAVGVGIAPEANAIADGPDADEPVELTARGGEAGCGCVGVVEDADAGLNPAGFQARSDGVGHAGAFELRQVG